MSQGHITYMRRALSLARRAEGRTSPNPLVGAVLVKEGQVVGEGYHRRAGDPHAEIEALRAAGDSAEGATMYITLEPCAHQGRTPPCTDALIAAGVAKVYSASDDPDPRVNGKGYAQLERASVKVRRGLCSTEARDLNRPFFKHVAHGRPLVTAKFAMSLDGKVATRSGQSQWITGEASRQQGHQLRNVSDAILIGAGTVISDDPQLTTRLSAPEDARGIRHPLRIVADSHGRTPISARVFDPELPGKTVLATTEALDIDNSRSLKGRGVQVWHLPQDARGRVSLAALLDEIGQRGMLTLMVEGGAQLLGGLLAEGLLDRVWAFVAPMIIGGRDAPGPVGDPGVVELAQAPRFANLKPQMLNGDLWIRADIVNSDSERPPV